MNKLGAPSFSRSVREGGDFKGPPVTARLADFMSQVAQGRSGLAFFVKVGTAKRPRGMPSVLGISLKDCHPDRSFSYPKGMRSGVEGPGVSCMNSTGQANPCFPHEQIGRGLAQSTFLKYLQGAPLKLRLGGDVQLSQNLSPLCTPRKAKPASRQEH